MLRDRTAAELAETLRGKHVLIWTCNTCARMCDIGGDSNAGALAEYLVSEGVDVCGVRSVSASCLTSVVITRWNEDEVPFDTVLALTCDMGALVVSRVLGKDMVNPLVTLGPGYRGRDGRPVLVDPGSRSESTLEECASRRGLSSGPFVY